MFKIKDRFPIIEYVDDAHVTTHTCAPVSPFHIIADFNGIRCPDAIFKKKVFKIV